MAEKEDFAAQFKRRKDSDSEEDEFSGPDDAVEDRETAEPQRQEEGGNRFRKKQGNPDFNPGGEEITTDKYKFIQDQNVYHSGDEEKQPAPAGNGKKFSGKPRRGGNQKKKGEFNDQQQGSGKPPKERKPKKAGSGGNGRGGGFTIAYVPKEEKKEEVPAVPKEPKKFNTEAKDFAKEVREAQEKKSKFLAAAAKNEQTEFVPTGTGITYIPAGVITQQPSNANKFKVKSDAFVPTVKTE